MSSNETYLIICHDKIDQVPEECGIGEFCLAMDTWLCNTIKCGLRTFQGISILMGLE